jgi:hypothetical protein
LHDPINSSYLIQGGKSRIPFNYGLDFEKLSDAGFSQGLVIGVPKNKKTGDPTITRSKPRPLDPPYFIEISIS